MSASLLGLTLALAVFDWLAAEKHWRRIHFILKPAVLLALIAWFSINTGWKGAALWFGLGLVCSLLGDVILELPERFFLPGLVAFLLAHVFYIVGFSQSPLVWIPSALVVGLAVLGAFAFVLSRLRQGLAHIEGGKRMLFPVIAYSLTISVMLASAWLCLCRPAWSTGAALAAGAGAFLFFCSDSLLAYDRFVHPFPHRELLVMGCYHLGQIGIVAGVILAGLG